MLRINREFWLALQANTSMTGIRSPFGMALFISVFAHIGAALYYVTLSK